MLPGENIPQKIVFHGNSVLGGAGATSPNKPYEVLAALRPSAVVVDAAAGGGGDIITLRANIADVTSLYDAGYRNYAVLLETTNYINDTRGEAAFGGDGLSLSDPNAAGQAYYDQVLLWVASVRAAGFLACVCTAPNAYEATASPLSNNTLYEQARDYAHALIMANPGQFDYTVDVAADSRMQTPSDPTYFDGSQIHLNNTGSTVLGGIIHAALPV